MILSGPLTPEQLAIAQEYAERTGESVAVWDRSPQPAADERQREPEPEAAG